MTDFFISLLYQMLLTALVRKTFYPIKTTLFPQCGFFYYLCIGYFFS